MKKYISLVLVALSGCILTVNAQQSFSYKNPLLPTELRVNEAHPTNPVECCADANPKTMLPNDT